MVTEQENSVVEHYKERRFYRISPKESLKKPAIITNSEAEGKIWISRVEILYYFKGHIFKKSMKHAKKQDSPNAGKKKTNS